jgi:hypothetical protein
MSRANLTALIERVEAARGPEWELDAEIAWLRTAPDKKRLGPPDLSREVWHAGLPTPAWVKWDSVASFHPRPTGSLDAAASLVPVGLFWTVAFGQLTPQEPLGGALISRRDGSDVAQAEAATPALALTAAALRARLASIGDDA